MLSQIGHADIEIELFNYSLYALGAVEGRDAENFWAMVLDPAMREVIMSISRKASALPSPDGLSWRDCFRETERQWIQQVPPEELSRRRDIEATAEIAARRTFERLADGIAARDRTISELSEQIGALQRERDARLGERVKRYWRRLRAPGGRN